MRVLKIFYDIELNCDPVAPAAAAAAPPSLSWQIKHLISILFLGNFSVS